MPTRETPFAPGTPCWVDLMTSDLAASKAFYGALFGWSFIDTGEEFGGYVNVQSDGFGVAGMMANPADSGSPDAWSTYISTADIDATVAAATEAGARVLVPAMAVGDLGSMAVMLDPAGAAIGAWQPGVHTGFGKYNEPGSVTWNETHSKDFAATKEFYTKVFGWTLQSMGDSDEFRYSTFQVDGQDVGGMMDSHSFLPPEIPSHWAVYFSVEDTDEALAKVAELGGTVLRPAEDTPFGRIADVLDATGIAFKLHSAKLLNPGAVSPS
jgi:predicted enzyme related to lactoylglutathione lyase